MDANRAANFWKMIPCGGHWPDWHGFKQLIINTLLLALGWELL